MIAAIRVPHAQRSAAPLPPERQLVYYATRITLEGYALIG